MTWRFAPDIDPTTPEIYTAMTRMLATPWGTYRTGPSTTSGGSLSGTQEATGSALFVKTDGTKRWLAGATSKIFDSDETGGTFTDRSGAVYAPTTAWQFGQFGDISIAVALGVTTQSSSSGNFADLGGTPPKAQCIAVQSNAVLLANYNDGAAVPDGWWASDVLSATTWTGGESANGRLVATPGPINCLIAFQGRVIAGKDSSIYEGQYVGGTVKWAWRVLHSSIGIGGVNCAATDGRLLFFLGAQGAWVYDGASFTRVDQGVEKYLQTNYFTSAAHIIYSYAEQLFLIYTGSSNTFANFCPVSQLWGVGDDSEVAGGVPYARYCPTKVPTGITRRAMAKPLVGPSLGALMTGQSYTFVTSSVTTGWIGKDRNLSNVSRVQPLYVPAGDYTYKNGSGTTFFARLTVKTAGNRAAAMTEVTDSPFIQTSRARFDLTKSDRWFEFKLTDTGGSINGLEGGMELAGLDIVSQPGGTD